VGLVVRAGWARSLALVALGAPVYTSVNSLGWALARSERYGYAVPMLAGAIGGLLAIAYLLASG
jgi:hypothetical protein